jgi:hypothetical protein
VITVTFVARKLKCTPSLGDRLTASLNVDTGKLFDDIVGSRHCEVDFFLNLGCTV